MQLTYSIVNTNNFKIGFVILFQYQYNLTNSNFIIATPQLKSKLIEDEVEDWGRLYYQKKTPQTPQMPPLTPPHRGL